MSYLSEEAITLAAGSDFGSTLTFEFDFHDPDDTRVVAFLEKNYDGDSLGIITWLLSQAQLKSRLVNTRTGAMIAFLAGLVLPVNTPTYNGNILFATLLCVLPPLRNTGLASKFLAANIAQANVRGHRVHAFTSDVNICFRPVNRMRRYLCKPIGVDPFGVLRRSLGATFTYTLDDHAEARASLAQHGPKHGIDWTRCTWGQDLKSIVVTAEEHKCAVILLGVNSVSHQVLGVACSKPRALRPFIAWVAAYLQTVIVLDSNEPMDRLEPCPCEQYGIYLHGTDTSEHAFVLPML